MNITGGGAHPPTPGKFQHYQKIILSYLMFMLWIGQWRKVLLKFHLQQKIEADFICFKLYLLNGWGGRSISKPHDHHTRHMTHGKTGPLMPGPYFFEPSPPPRRKWPGGFIHWLGGFIVWPGGFIVWIDPSNILPVPDSGRSSEFLTSHFCNLPCYREGCPGQKGSLFCQKTRTQVNRYVPQPLRL